MKVTFPTSTPAIPCSYFDAEAVYNTLAGHIAELEAISPAVMAKIDSIQLTIAPVISYRVEAVIIPKS